MDFPDYEKMSHREYKRQIKKLQNKHTTMFSRTGYLRVHCRDKNTYPLADKFRAIATIEIPAFTTVKKSIWLNFVDMETKSAYIKKFERFDGTELDENFECRLNGTTSFMYDLRTNEKVHQNKESTIFYNTNKEDLKKNYGWFD
ncbi:hypothetical protein mvi_999 [Megavirus vitis]|uniref:Uncharacterized protein n=1 Tax=Megavirus courdo7 TaxID=1128135 RepID=H2ECN7_9VIRU|nr:hypothetical protein c7_R1298 [Megavirus courdo7]AVL94359.1 hypothetical protein mvi_999 [Megavirus vitis]